MKPVACPRGYYNSKSKMSTKEACIKCPAVSPYSIYISEDYVAVYRDDYIKD